MEKHGDEFLIALHRQFAILRIMTELTLKQEVALLRSAVIGLIGKDAEGKYRPEFVKSTVKAIAKAPTKHFISARQFLSDIAKA